jgi:hypothetical protein
LKSAASHPLFELAGLQVTEPWPDVQAHEVDVSVAGGLFPVGDFEPLLDGPRQG